MRRFYIKLITIVAVCVIIIGGLAFLLGSLRSVQLLRVQGKDTAAALEVSVAELLGSQPHTMRSKPGPVSQLQRRFEQVKLLPRKDQEFVLKFLDTVLERRQSA